MRLITLLLASFPLALARPALAEVTQQSEAGFIVRVTTDMSVGPVEAWKAFSMPSRWWVGQHTFSGDAANLTLDAVAGGCLCEALPPPKDAPATQKAGSVLHMRVVYAEPYRALRLIGGLGPLQSEAVTGTMTVTFKAIDGSNGKATRILWEYVVGGYMRYRTEAISAAIDRMLTSQLASLARVAGPVPKSQAVAPKAKDEERRVDPAPTERYIPDPARDEAAAAASVKSVLDRIFAKDGDRSPEGR